MKIERIFTYCLLAGTFLLASCSSEAADDNASPLPEGKYPVTFTATGLQVTAATRGTADGTWDGYEAVAVKIGNEVRKYVADGGGASTTLKAAEGVTPFYWQSTNNIDVSAWYCGTEYKGTLPETWSVQPDQRSDGYQQSDFLYAHGSLEFNPSSGNELKFYHQTAKVVINIRKYGVATDASKITSVKINAIKDGIFSTFLTDKWGLTAKTDATLLDITSCKLSSPNTAVAFEGATETALASYQALVIPQAVDGTTVTININGYAPFKYTPTIPTQSEKAWKGGTQYTYNLTISGSKVTATVSSSIGWTDGTTGSGSVEIE